MTNAQTYRNEPYRVKIDIFEGPLDLLLHLIKKNEVDIYDIPIALITQQYLEYLEIMKQLNLDIAGEFLVMASELMHIKSRMLLPSPHPGEEEEQGPDPREELVRRLLEYQQFKEAAELLKERNLLGRDIFVRGTQSLEWMKTADGLSLEPVSIFQLVEAFRQVLMEAGEELVHEITVDRMSVRQRILEIMEMFRDRENLTFKEFFEPNASKSKKIVTFLAILELIRLAVLRAHQEGEFGVIRIFKTLTTDKEKLEDKIVDDYL